MSAPMSAFEKLWREQKLCDALLNVAGTQFWAHKLVLCDCSTFFMSLFTQWSSPDDQEFDITHVSADIMKIILDYAYTRVVHITQKNLMELFEAADFFDISGITQACYQAMAERLSPSNCIATWELTNTYYNPHLKNQAFLYILKHFEEVIANSKALIGLSLENLCSIIVENQLNVKDESIVFKAVLKWIEHAPRERNMYLSKLLSKIRLARVHPKHFTQQIRHNILIQNNPTYKNVVNVILYGPRGYTASPFSPHLTFPRRPQVVLLAFGGSCNLQSESYDNRANRWVTSFEKTTRSYHGTVFLHGSVYLIGGSDGLIVHCTMYKYDLVNHTCQEVAPMHTMRCRFSVALLDGFIYAMGGSDGLEYLNTAEKYFPDTNQWTMIAPMNEQRVGAGSTTYNRKIYICGGVNGSEDLSTAESYDPLTNQWTMISAMSSGRSGVGVIAYFDEIYVLGGFSGGNNLKTVEAYNPKTNTWRTYPSMLIGRSYFGVGVVEDKLYAVGGKINFCKSCVESFDMQTKMWSKVCDLSFSRCGLSCSVVSDLPNMADYSVAHSSPPEAVPEE